MSLVWAEPAYRSFGAYRPSILGLAGWAAFIFWGMVGIMAIMGMLPGNLQSPEA